MTIAPCSGDEQQDTKAPCGPVGGQSGAKIDETIDIQPSCGPVGGQSDGKVSVVTQVGLANRNNANNSAGGFAIGGPPDLHVLNRSLVACVVLIVISKWDSLS